MKAFWIIFQIIFGIVALLVVWFVLAAIKDDNTRLIVAVLGLVHTGISSMLLQQLVMQADLHMALDLKFHELMQMAEPDRQPPDHHSVLAILQTRWVGMTFSSLIWFVCLSRSLSRSINNVRATMSYVRKILPMTRPRRGRRLDG
jgi:hypothetical protein